MSIDDYKRLGNLRVVLLVVSALAIIVAAGVAVKGQSANVSIQADDLQAAEPYGTPTVPATSIQEADAFPTSLSTMSVEAALPKSNAGGSSATTLDQTSPRAEADVTASAPNPEPAADVPQVAGQINQSTTIGETSTSKPATAATSKPTTTKPTTTRLTTSRPTTAPTTQPTTAPTSQATTTSTTRSTTQTTQGPANPNSNFGFSSGGWFPHESESILRRDLDLMAESGATWIRIDFDWSSIEATRGDYHWHRTDRIIDAAAARGMKVLGLITESPSWARAPGLSSQAPPNDPADYARFAAAAANRYGSRGVEAWELWNEPNLAMFWQPRPDPEAYARLAGPAVAAIRAADPGTFIVSGGLAPAADEANGSGISPSTFVTGMINAGVNSFDAYAIHPYSYPARPIDPSTAGWNPFNNLPQFRSLLQSLGQGGKPIWLTEYGAPTGTSSRAVSEAEQSAQIREAIQAADNWSWTGPLFLYSHRDERNAPADFQSNFGLMRNDGSPKQAWRDLLANRN